MPAISYHNTPYQTLTISVVLFITRYSYDLSCCGHHPDFDIAPEPFTSPVDFFAPNGYGLHDIAGNVWEFCNEWHPGYEGQYRVVRVVNPTLCRLRVRQAREIQSFSCRLVRARHIV